jgi:DNA polymerase III delta prime subunit
MPDHPPAQLFYSYAHEDEVLRNTLEKHLSLLQRQDLIAPWHDRQIPVGSEWTGEINKHLDTATIILLLISPDFLASDYCYDIEMQRAIERHKSGEAHVIPIILRPCSWQSAPFGSLQALPKDGRPLTTWPNQDEAFLEVEQGIRALIAQPPIVPRPSVSSAAATQNRENMLLRLEKMYKDLLDDSLQEIAWIELGLTEKPGAVRNAANLVLRRTPQTAHPLPPGTSILQIYHQSNQELLILGEPGAGKSTLLYHLGRELLNIASQQSTAPFPILFPLSSWAEKKRLLQEWMIEQLSSPLYQIPRKQSQQWVQEQQIIPLLDGLDEMEEEAQLACITAINEYRREHPLRPLVVCSRSEEYANAAKQEQLHLQSAIEVQPLSHGQLDAVLTQAGEPFTALHKELKRNTELRELASSPLWLNVMLLTFKDTSVRSLPQQRSKLQQRLFQRYVERMVEYKGKGTGKEKQYPLNETVRWLSWLARQMRLRNQTVFAVEQLQPDWLEKRLRVIYRWNVGLIIGSFAGLIIGSFAGLIIGSFAGLIIGVLIGLAFGLLAGLAFGSLAGLIVWRVNEITLAERVTWSREQALLGLISGLLFGLFAGLGAGFDDLLFRNIGPSGLSIGLLFGLSAVLIGGVLGGLKSNTYIDRHAFSPGEGIRRSVVNGLSFGLLGGLLGGISSGLSFGLSEGLSFELYGGLIGGLLGGLTGGFLGGLNAVIQHFLLRFWLWRSSCFPFEAGAFLEDARARHLLQRVGGSYRFVHQLLLDYFADLD